MENDEKNLLMHVSAQVTALEFAVKVLIAAHPEPSQLAGAWRARVSDLVDAGLEDGYCQRSPTFQQTLMEQLRQLSLFLPPA